MYTSYPIFHGTHVPHFPFHYIHNSTKIKQSTQQLTQIIEYLKYHRNCCLSQWKKVLFKENCSSSSKKIQLTLSIILWYLYHGHCNIVRNFLCLNRGLMVLKYFYILEGAAKWRHNKCKHLCNVSFWKGVGAGMRDGALKIFHDNKSYSVYMYTQRINVFTASQNA